MPIVPFRSDTPAQPSVKPPPDVFLWMAAAQMHKEGRLVQGWQGPIPSARLDREEWQGQPRSMMQIQGQVDDPADLREQEMQRQNETILGHHVPLTIKRKGRETEFLPGHEI